MNVPFLVEWLQKNHFRLCESMHNSTHHFVGDGNFHDDSDMVSVNPYHFEGDVWAHAMMVMKMAEHYKVDEDIRLAALCHDFGKPLARMQKPEKGRTSFYGHAGISAYIGYEVLKNLKPDMEHSQMRNVLELVNWHQNLFEQMDVETELLKRNAVKEYGYQPIKQLHQLLQLMKCDSQGRFSNDTRPYMNYTKNVGPQFDGIVDSLIGQWTKEFGENVPDRTITLLIGPPSCGKSTYVKEKCEGSNILSRDNIIMELSPKYMSYDQAWASVDQKLVDSTLQGRFGEYKKDSKDIVVDMTNMSKKSRRKWLGGVPKRYAKQAVVVMAGFDEIHRRNRQRDGKMIPDKVIIDMMGRFHAPLYSEFDSISWYFT